MKTADSYKESDILKFIGLAARASKVVSGSTAILEEAKRGHIKVLLIASDISENSLKDLLDNVAKTDKGIPAAYKFSDKRSLGNAIGKPDRALVGITDEGFAGKLELMLERLDDKEGQNL